MASLLPILASGTFIGHPSIKQIFYQVSHKTELEFLPSTRGSRIKSFCVVDIEKISIMVMSSTIYSHWE